MQYDFETIRVGKREGSIKWMQMHRRKGDVCGEAVPFTVADMEFGTAPEIKEALKEYVDGEILGYTAPTQAYYDAVAGWMRERHGFTVTDGSIVVSPGVVTALYMAVRAFSSPGEGVIVMPPVYHPLLSAVEDNGRRLAPCPLRQGASGWKMDFAALRKSASRDDVRLLLLCSPHNPVGRVWTRDELLELAGICEKNGVLVVSDEIHHDLIMPGHRHTVFGTLPGGAGQSCIVCTAPSKTFNLAGLQTSNIIIREEMQRRSFEGELRKTAFFTPGALGLRGCEAAYTKGAGWLGGLLGVLDENRCRARAFMEEYLPHVGVSDMQGTYLQWYDFRALDGERLRRSLYENDLFFSEGSGFGAQGAGFYRVNIACPKSVLYAALKRLRKAVRECGLSKT